MKLIIPISPQKITAILTIIVLCVVLGGIATQFSKYFLADFPLKGTMIRLLHLDNEANIPAWYSSAMLLICAILLAIVTMAKKKENDLYTYHWGILAIIFLSLSLDEVASIHEQLGKLVYHILRPSGFFYYAWVIPAIILVIIFGLSYLRFLFNLPFKKRLLFILAGSLYVGGAVGMELIGGRYASLYGEASMMYEMIATLEEFLEMIGIVTFIYALTSYLHVYVQNVQFHFTAEASSRVRKEQFASVRLRPDQFR